MDGVAQVVGYALRGCLGPAALEMGDNAEQREAEQDRTATVRRTLPARMPVSMIQRMNCGMSTVMPAISSRPG